MKNNARNGWGENVRLLEELEESRRLIDGSFASHQIRSHSRRDRKESGQTVAGIVKGTEVAEHGYQENYR
jgi:hypothetical protein